MKLKAIWFDVDFRCSEATNYLKFTKQPQFPGELRDGEAFLFVSKSGNQLVWLLNRGTIESITKQERTVTDSRKWRLSGGTWGPNMLGDYAREVGIELIGLPTFREQYEARRS